MRSWIRGNLMAYYYDGKKTNSYALIRNTLALVATVSTTDAILGRWKAPRRWSGPAATPG
ncbi:hypothetical protein ABE83_31240 [Streptomyces sp. CFMR 7]|nr:hypothetical protein ABE83_31240 [Streptomyces sp. CFMR 7]